MEQIKKLWNNLIALLTSQALINTVLRVILALIILWVSFKIINRFTKRIEKRGEKKHADKTILKTLVYALRVGLKILVAICMVGFVGIDTSGLTALVTSLGVCIGLAVNGALSNLAGGVLIIFTRPFKVDDYIEAQGKAGTVAEIKVTMTKLITPDNKVVYIPNGILANEEIINYSECDERRVDLKFSVAYDADVEKAKQLITDICLNHQLVLKNKDIFVRVGEYADSSIDITTRVWSKKDDYWTVYFDIMEQVGVAFDKNDIEIPFNQLDVTIKNNPTIKTKK